MSKASERWPDVPGEPVTKPYEFIGFGAMDVTKPYEFIGFGAMSPNPMNL